MTPKHTQQQRRMEQLNCQTNSQSTLTPISSLSESSHLPPDSSHSGKQNPEAEQDFIAARKVQKADRERLRRDRLNEQFTELGNTLGMSYFQLLIDASLVFVSEPMKLFPLENIDIDPDRPKNDKASILSDTILVLKDLTAQVGRLKSEYAALTDESRELTQEKTDLREEKASLKSEIESLNAQHQQRLRTMYPWAGIDHSMVMHPPTYSYPVPVPIPTGPMPMHPSLHPYPFFGNQNPATVPNPCPFVPYMSSRTLLEQHPTQQISPVMQPSGSGRQESRNKSSIQGENKAEKSGDSNEVATDLELKTPGSASEQDLSLGQTISRKLSRKDNGFTDGSSSSRCSSSQSVQAISSNSVVRGSKDK